MSIRHRTVIRLTRDVETFPNTVKPAGYDKLLVLRLQLPKKEEYGSVLKKGTLLTEWHDSPSKYLEGNPRCFTEEPDGRQGYHRPIPEDAFEVVSPDDLRAADFDFWFKVICSGGRELPYFEPVYSDDAEGMANLMSRIAAGGGAGATGVSHVHLPIEFCPTPYEQNSRWARLFPWYTQGGALDGRGYIVLYDPFQGKQRVPIGGTYSLCKHEYIKQPTGREHRGDHRGHCGKCGLDMSVDSSD